METFKNLLIGTLKIFILIVLAIFMFYSVDSKLGYTAPMEIGTVIHKTFMPPGTYHKIKSPPPHYTLIVIQPNKWRSYYMSVPRDYFYDIDEGDKVPMRKQYGLITGWEYEREILMD